MNSIKAILNSFLNTHGDWRMELVRNWRTIVGDLSSKMSLEKVINRTIIIGVYDSHWMHEFYMLSDVILQKINEKLGGNFVKNIRFVIAKQKIAKSPKASGKKNISSTKIKKSLLTTKINRQQQNSTKEVYQPKTEEKLLKIFKNIEDKVKDEELKLVLKNLLLKTRKTE